MVIKLAIIIGAAYFIYDKLAHNSQLNFDVFSAQLKASGVFKISTISILLLATFLNWFVEIIKWKTLVQHIKYISLWESTAHSLGGLTASLFTPNRIGEYGAKALYFPKSERKKVLGLNFLGNIAQLVATAFFGMIGFSFFVYQFGVELPWHKILRMFVIITLIGGIFILGIKQKRFQIKGFSWNSLKSFTKKISNKIHLKNISFSFIRYIIFAHQFYFLLLLFGLNTSYLTAMSAITAMYLITSLIPMLFIFDVIVKGSVAVWLFGYLDFPELSILSIVSLMWIFNFVLPSIVGSYFVLNFNPSFTEEKSMAS
ncbi:lysylphosphatidylglycerol synthase domain-containing protein [Kordia antarctica]|uniref:lysylphosphatidylglycerol synthase domain-containing protein n=1 Tax=Kordia antarctica TaxID=1218801 RepID=UPI001D143111|nr:lysylphosphatidylglycerol synthase domain-containing protein [Kordia antarctica]